MILPHIMIAWKLSWNHVLVCRSQEYDQQIGAYAQAMQTLHEQTQQKKRQKLMQSACGFSY